jgi:hypothetical protein
VTQSVTALTPKKFAHSVDSAGLHAKAFLLSREEGHA